MQTVDIKSKSENTEVRSDSVLALLFVHLDTDWSFSQLAKGMVQHNLAGVGF